MVYAGVSSGKAKPALFVGDGVAICHLTNGFNDPDHLLPAFSATGEVAVSGPATAVKTHTVNFIQFQKLRNHSMLYSTGELVLPERVLIDASSPPALTANPALDSSASTTPFTNADPLILNAGKAINVMADHPASKHAISLTHRSDGRTAMIASITDSREFWTSFVVRPPGGALQYLAHFHWEINYSFGLEWELDISGDMRVRLVINTSTFKFDSPVLGPPTAGDISGMLATPSPPQANDVGREAILTAVLGGPPNRLDLTF